MQDLLLGSKDLSANCVRLLFLLVSTCFCLSLWFIVVAAVESVMLTINYSFVVIVLIAAVSVVIISGNTGGNNAHAMVSKTIVVVFLRLSFPGFVRVIVCVVDARCYCQRLCCLFRGHHCHCYDC